MIVEQTLQHPDTELLVAALAWFHHLTPYPFYNDFNAESLLAYNISLLIYIVNSYPIDCQCFS